MNKSRNEGVEGANNEEGIERERASSWLAQLRFTGSSSACYSQAAKKDRQCLALFPGADASETGNLFNLLREPDWNCD